MPGSGGGQAICSLVESSWWLVSECHQYLCLVTWSPSHVFRKGSRRPQAPSVSRRWSHRIADAQCVTRADEQGVPADCPVSGSWTLLSRSKLCNPGPCQETELNPGGLEEEGLGARPEAIQPLHPRALLYHPCTFHLPHCQAAPPSRDVTPLPVSQPRPQLSSCLFDTCSAPSHLRQSGSHIVPSNC